MQIKLLGIHKSRISIMFDEHNDYVNSAQHSRHLQMLQQSANEGDAEAQYELADCYFHGNGVEKDEEKAFQLYEDAAKQGLIRAQCALGLCYFRGHGVEKNEKKAFEALSTAARHGLAIAFYYCGLMTERGYTDTPPNPEKAMIYHTLAVMNGSAIAVEKFGKRPKLVEEFRQVARQYPAIISLLMDVTGITVSGTAPAPQAQ